MTDDDIIAASRDAFLQEAREMLNQLESSLLGLGAGEGMGDDGDADTLNAAFRAAHTIKGSSGLFGYTAVVAFTHEVETVLDAMRDGRLGADDALVTLLLQARDQIERLVETVGQEPPADVEDEGRRLVGLLRQALQANGEAAPAAAPAPAVKAAAASETTGGGEWHISLRFKPDTFRNGFDPLSFVRYLSTVGDITSLATLTDPIPPLETLDPESCHLGLELRLRTEAERAIIEAVFEFVLDDLDLHLLAPASRAADYVRLIEELHEDRDRLGEILVSVGAITQRELDEVLQVQREHGAPPRVGELLVQQTKVPEEVVQAAVNRQQALRDKKSEENRVVRVPADKLDLLIDLIGELVIAGSAARLVATQEGSSRFAEAATRICGLVEAARDGALKLRMVQIGDTFSRFRRVVHDVSRTLGKQVELVMTGGETELDKSMVELIADPLMHLVRNSLDHGIETSEQRVAAGKPASGQLRLNAYHDSGSIVIEVRDDGRGIDRAKVLAKAIERDIVKPGQTLAEDEILQLIFMPGFSTAAQVTDISGRGVGMDVVKRNIEALRGQISIDSTPGQGTSIQIRVPLTLAIIDGFLVAVGAANYIVPLELVVECIETPPEAIEVEGVAAGCFNLRGEVLPFLCLRELFGIEGRNAARRSVVVVKYGPAKVGLIVDRLLGEYQTVIKPLGRLFSALRGIAGSTILGSGEVALILDVPALVTCAAQRTQTSSHVDSSSMSRVAPERTAASVPQ